MSTEEKSSAQSNTTTETEMRISINPERASQLANNLRSVQSRIQSTLKAHHLAATTTPRRLVAVSKLKPATDILALHSPPTSHQHFGENYVQELVEKSRLLPATIKWHMIGGLQSNKCAQLAREVDNLWAVESVDSIKKAQLLDKGRGERRRRRKEQESDNDDDRLRVFVQVNTSGEESKSGVEPDSTDLLDLCRYIHGNSCPNLKLQGLMTIGAIARSRATTAETANEDFVCLRETRDRVADQLALDRAELELSMGMSEDFEGALVQGSNEVRVGSTIFGERPPKKEAKVLEDAG